VVSRLVLWDIDGTLASCGQTAQALRSVRRITGELEVAPHVVISGRTDLQILRELNERCTISDVEGNYAVATQ